MKQYSKENIIYCQDTNETVTGDNYLKSKHWKNLRKSILRERGCICQKCRYRIPPSQLHIHHKTYEHIGNEYDEDLLVVCGDCHSKIHKKNVRGKRRLHKEASRNVDISTSQRLKRDAPWKQQRVQLKQWKQDNKKPYRIPQRDKNNPFDDTLWGNMTDFVKRG